MIQDLHKIMTVFYEETDWCRDLYIYVLDNYNTFKISK